MSFGARVALALGFLALVSTIEVLLRGPRRATRWRGSLALIASGVAGAAFGALQDLLTVSFGPAYFVVGKGLAPGGGLIGDAMALGAQAGAGAGVVAGGVLLLAGGGPRDARRLAASALRVARGAALGLAAGLAVGAALPGSLAAAAGFAVAAAAADGFVTVWGGHLGSYAGALVALVASARWLRRGRRAGGGISGGAIPGSAISGSGIPAPAPRPSAAER